MGLAASQARFLGITLRKANCEFKSTELAQQKLELTNQMTDISQEYANALNSTRLVWQNEAVTDSFGNPCDYGLSYSLLMMPSAANDFNPYMISTKSGAIVLNSKYAEAAKAAGISMAGGTPSQQGRDKFLKSLSTATSGTNDNVITEHTYEVLTGQFLTTSPSYKGADVSWHYSAGMGAIPKDKGVADATTLSDLIMDKNIGQQALDWLQIYKYEKGSNGLTETEYESVQSIYAENVKVAKLNYINSGFLDPVNNTDPSANVQVAGVIEAAKKELASGSWDFSSNPPKLSGATGIMAKFNELELKIAGATSSIDKARYERELELLKSGWKTNGTDLVPADGSTTAKNGHYEEEFKYPLYWELYQQSKADAQISANLISWSTDVNDYNTSDNDIGINKLLQADSTNNTLGKGKYEVDGAAYNQISVVVNDVIVHSESDLKGMTVSDLLTENIVLMAQREGGREPEETLETAAKALLEYVAKLLGLGNIGTGLNIDTDTSYALEQALAMTEKKILKAGNAIKDCGGNDEQKSITQNDAYKYANSYNRICVNDKATAAINMSNVISAFLTYYDNFLRGTDSEYVVGKAIDATESSKTFFVTDDPSYVYVTNHDDELTNDEKEADFWNQLYNNICAHGWRYDDMVQDTEYFESAIKDGRYQLMALNDDGYFYQMRYNDIGYMVEETDDDAITRAEVDYTRKKSEITFKEDSIDIKTKKLDAEIAELTTEMNSVQNIISKSIEKTFAMFSN